MKHFLNKIIHAIVEYEQLKLFSCKLILNWCLVVGIIRLPVFVLLKTKAISYGARSTQGVGKLNGSEKQIYVITNYFYRFTFSIKKRNKYSFLRFILDDPSHTLFSM